MRGFARSLSVPVGLAWALLISPQFAGPALAQDPMDAPPQASATSLKTSGAADMMVAYQLALLAHYDSVLGNDSAASADLHAASEHLSLAEQAVTGVKAPSAQSQPQGAPGSSMTPGGGGGPGSSASPQAREPDMARILGALHSLADSTQSDISPESTTRLVAAMTGEYVQMGRAGGGGGPEATMPTKMTAIEHVGLAYALVGQAQSDVAMRNYAEAKGALDQAGLQLGAARKAEGGAQLSRDISRMSAAVKDAGTSVASKRSDSAEATMRAVREITTSLTAMASPQNGTAAKP